MSYATQARTGTELNRLYDDDAPVHEWYRFVLSYPPHLVRDWLARTGIGPGQTVLDPFCGTGTTLVECRKSGVESVGIEANPVVRFAAGVKTDWTPEPDALLEDAYAVANAARAALGADGVPDEGADEAHAGGSLRTLPPEQMRLLITDSISPRVLHKALVLRDRIDEIAHADHRGHLRLAFAKHLVHSSSNLRFGPEVGIGKRKPDAPVVAPWLTGVEAMAADLRALPEHAPEARVLHGDARMRVRSSRRSPSTPSSRRLRTRTRRTTAARRASNPCCWAFWTTGRASARTSSDF